MLSHGETGYEWVERDDPRVREERLLGEVGRVGEVTGEVTATLRARRSTTCSSASCPP